VTGHVLPRVEAGTDGAEQLRQLRRDTLALLLMPLVVPLMTFLAVDTTNLVVLHEAHILEESAAVGARKLKKTLFQIIAVTEKTENLTVLF
jgi:hypothetical protein